MMLKRPRHTNLGVPAFLYSRELELPGGRTSSLASHLNLSAVATTETEKILEKYRYEEEEEEQAVATEPEAVAV